MTNLNEAFWRWFGNSVIRHEDGTPRIVYHGTRSPVEFDVFQTGSIFDEEEDELLVSGSNDASAFLGPHFTESLQLATKFAEGKAASWDRSRYIHKEGKGRVIPVYLRIENPKVFENDDEVWNFIWKYGESRELDDFFELHEIEQISTNIWYDPEEEQRYTTAELNERFFFETSDESESGHSPREVAAEELGTSARDALIKLGHDGIVYLNTVEGGGHSYVVFESNQIKSADRNVGTWNRENDSILAGPFPFAYHITRRQNLASIAKRGLVPRFAGAQFADDDPDDNSLFFTDLEEYITCASVYGDTLLRFPWPEQWKPYKNKYDRTIANQFITNSIIPPEVIEVRTELGWKSLK
jgi:hypothetical protein